MYMLSDDEYINQHSFGAKNMEEINEMSNSHSETSINIEVHCFKSHFGNSSSKGQLLSLKLDIIWFEYGDKELNERSTSHSEVSINIELHYFNSHFGSIGSKV